MLKKDGMIRHTDSIVYETYKKLKKHKDTLKQKAKKIQQDLCSGNFCISEDNQQQQEVNE